MNLLSSITINPSKDNIKLEKNMSHFSNVFCGLVILFLVDFSECSFYNSSKSNLHIQNEDSQKIFDIQVHGILLWASVGFLMPVGILAMRMSSCSQDVHPSTHKILFYVHAISQVLSVLAVTVGAVLSIRKFENHFDNSHQRIGLALYAAIYLQVVIGFKRPKRGVRRRRTWYFAHWLFGTSVCLVGILNIYTGLQAYHRRTSKSPKLWAVIFTAQIIIMVIFYLFQDKWKYILKQGMSTSTIAISPTTNSNELENQIKEGENEAGRRSNALGTHFLRNNALNKLFQLT